MRNAMAERQNGLATGMAGLADIVNADPALLRRRRHLYTTCQFDIRAHTFLLRIGNGRIAEVRGGPFVAP